MWVALFLLGEFAEQQSWPLHLRLCHSAYFRFTMFLAGCILIRQIDGTS